MEAASNEFHLEDPACWEFKASEAAKFELEAPHGKLGAGL